MNSDLRKKRNRTAMAHFTQEELDQIGLWLRQGDLTLDQIADNCEKQFSKKAETWNLSRLRRDLCLVQIDEDNEDLKDCAAEINHYAVTGEAGLDGRGFHSATVILIEKQAFELALQINGARKVSKDDHGRFKDLFRMKLAHENAQTKKQYTTHRIDLDKKKIELAQRKQTHHELVTEQKRLDRKNIAHARFGLLPPTPQETTALAEKLNLFQSTVGTSAAAASGSTLRQTEDHTESQPVKENTPKSIQPSDMGGTTSTLSQTENHNENPEAAKNTTALIPPSTRTSAPAASGSTLSQTNNHNVNPKAKKNTTPPVTSTLPSSNGAQPSSAIDPTIQWKDPRTWPAWYRKINNRPLLRYVARRKIRYVTRETLIPGKLIGWSGPQTLSAEYKLRLMALNIPFQDEPPIRKAA